MATPHNQAERGEIARTVLMPGDPLRAKYIAEKYLENAKCFNTVRNMFGFTGTHKGKELSVMGSGMGMPSMGIYSYELYNNYDVENIIRIGSAGAYCDELEMLDIVLAESSWSESTYAKTQANVDADILYPSAMLNDKIVKAAEHLSKKITPCRVHSCDVFYHEDGLCDYDAIYRNKGCFCVDMESFALFHNAKVLGKQAACMLTISDSFTKKQRLTAEERQSSFDDMMQIALAAAISL